jgi:transcriptional regulator with XRE-family HTH domain
MNGLELKEKRKKLGLTQTQLADKVGVAMRTVQNWEKETNKIPKSTELLIDDLIRSTEISYLNTPTIVEESNPEYRTKKKIDIESPAQKESDHEFTVVSRLTKMLDDAYQEIKILRQELDRKKNN